MCGKKKLFACITRTHTSACVRRYIIANIRASTVTGTGYITSSADAARLSVDFINDKPTSNTEQIYYTFLLELKYIHIKFIIKQNPALTSKIALI